ncbi:MAG TPA: tetratricopeptide repeat protein [Trebonia sp.]
MNRVRRDGLAQRRKALGLTQEQLAALLDVERTTVARWERGEAQPQPWLRPRLARALRVSPERIEAFLAGHESPRAGGTARAVPRQLPPTVPDFTGRAAELDTLTRMLDEDGAGAPGTLVISAIGGTAGVGKTALALHWAHLVADRFDGQLYVNLRGFDPSGTPVTADETIRGFLDALGVPPGKIPPLPDAQAGMYRSLLAGQRMLIVLDNALDEQQVRPLLPASPGSLVLVTSRSQLSGLAASDGARLLSLDVLPNAEAVQLLTTRIGAGRAAAEPDAVSEIAGLCACLPLALAVAAARVAARPGLPLSALAAELGDTAGQLDALDTGDPAMSVRTVFSWSYRQLSPNTARMFRLLGLHPGPDISVPAAASLAAADQPAARRLLRELTRAHLIAEHAPGRYACHDLLRAYAAAQVRDRDSEDERAAATTRLLDHYLHTAAHCSLTLNPTREQVTLAVASPGAVPERVADPRQAMGWLEAEYQVLLAAVALAAECGFNVHAWQLPWAFMPYQSRRGRYQELRAAQRTALAAATRLRDDAGQAISSRLLATACMDLDDYDRALGYLETSLRLYRRLGNRAGEAMVHQSLAMIEEHQGRYADALGSAKQGLRLFRDIGDKARQAHMLFSVGHLHLGLGDYQEARAFCRQALTLNAEGGHDQLEGYIWCNLGDSEQHLGNLAEAAACNQHALRISREVGDRFLEASTLAGIADALHAGGDLPQARKHWEQALFIFDELAVPDAQKVRAKLAGTTDHPDGSPRGASA